MTFPKGLYLLSENYPEIIKGIGQSYVEGQNGEFSWIYQIKLHDGFLTHTGDDEIHGESLDEILAKWHYFQMKRFQ